ncbi:hypothetical protein BKA58DRAFT_321293 [Alternaria rosae]|uniref:uncharacterized protein n=1 Tax=Alternaria rosae TaxID=1187941 RepID=UPI001E8DA195|nr:uncharacterized protein BKA58DRAFT_321293 [Alternaria rosae]KAH6865872.1 hypothetical protein BKA58DRAFT_321293 [Alternaria rosae]
MQKRTIPSPQTQYPPPPGTQPITRPGPSAVTYHIPVSPSFSRTTISLPCHSTWTSGLHFHTQHTEYLHLVRGSIFVYLDGQTRILSAAAGGAVSVYGSNKIKDSDGPRLVIQIPKYARHNWGRAREYLASHRPSCVRPRYPLDIDDEVVVEEWTDPADGGKALFFWNLNGIVMQKQYSGALPPLQHLARWVLGRWWVEFQLWNVFWELDNWPVVLGLRGVFGEGWDRLPELLWVERGKRKVEGWLEWLVTLVLLGLARGVGWIVRVRAVEKERTPVALWEEYQRKGRSG